MMVRNIKMGFSHILKKMKQDVNHKKLYTLVICILSCLYYWERPDKIFL